jgi:fructose-specific phosphotransferase system IIC component
MRTYKKVLIAIGAIIADFLISYLISKHSFHTSVNDFYYELTALMFVVPLALSTAGLVIFGIIRLIHDIYIGIRHGIEAAYKDHENNRDNF